MSTGDPQLDISADNVVVACTLVAVQKASEAGVDLARHGRRLVDEIDAKVAAALARGPQALVLLHFTSKGPRLIVGTNDDRLRSFVAEAQAAGEPIMGFNPSHIETLAETLGGGATWLPPSRCQTEAPSAEGSGAGEPEART